MSLALTRINDQYETVAKIKQGGMGEIFKVRHRLLDEIRVVKVLHSELEGDSALNQRFAREARAAIQLRHPNIVQIFDFTLDGSGTGLIVMEYIHGVDLQQLIAQPQRPSIALTLEIARQGLRALGYLHRSGFVHRDVSPDNLMLSRDVEGRPLIKLIDLGIAKRRGSDPQLTASGMFLGKFRYSSPEHFGVQGSDGIEKRSDLYTFGLVLYELLTGSSPIEGESTSELIAGHLFQPPKGFNETDPDQRIPETLRRLILKTLAKDADDRFASAEELIEQLETLQQDFPLDRNVFEESRRFVEDESIQQPPVNDTPIDARPIDARPVEVAAPAVEPLTGGGSNSQEESHSSPLGPKSSQALEVDREAPTEIAPPNPPSQITPPPAQVESLLVNAQRLYEANHLSAARSQLETILELDPQHAAAQGLLNTLEARQEQHSSAIDGLVAEVDQLLQSGKLIEADRVLFQARETHGAASELTTMKARLDALYQRGVESEVHNLMSRADLLVQEDDYTQALEVLEKARATAPSKSSLVGDVDNALASLQRNHNTRQANRSITELEDRLNALIQDQELVAARTLLDQAAGELATEPAFEPLRNRLTQALSGRIQALVKQAGIANEGQNFATAIRTLDQVLELEPDNSWIRKQLEQAEIAQREQQDTAQRERTTKEQLTTIGNLIDAGELEVAARRLHSAITLLGPDEAFLELEQQLAQLREEAEVRFFCHQAEEAKAEDDILRARLLAAKALELRPGDPYAAALAKTLDREHRAAELRLSTLPATPLTPAQSEALSEIAVRRSQGDTVAAWRLLQDAIENFGEIESFTTLRRQIAEEILDDGDGVGS